MTACIQIPLASPPGRLAVLGLTLEQQDVASVCQPAIAPLLPIFDVVDAVIAAFDCINAIPAMFGPPPDPTLLAPALERLAEKAMKLLRLVPQLSVPYTIVDVVDVVVAELHVATEKLRGLQARFRAMARAAERAAELRDDALAATVACARLNVEREADNVGRGLAGVGKLLELASALLAVIGAPALPSLLALGGQAMDVVVDVLVEGLLVVRRAIPLR